jgi:hypothetical protein
MLRISKAFKADIGKTKCPPQAEKIFGIAIGPSHSLDLILPATFALGQPPSLHKLQKLLAVPISDGVISAYIARDH